MLVGLVEQVSVDLGASQYIATDRTQSLHASSGGLGLVAAMAIKQQAVTQPSNYVVSANTAAAIW